MRNNPLQHLPPEIHTMSSLHTLVLSFCRLLQLPNQLYSLPCLQHLDVSYNLLTSLSSSIRNLRSLRSLNVEGNQLLGLPAGVCRLSLHQLRLALNYTHPALWNTHTHTHSPQRLEHTAARALTLTHLNQHTLPTQAQQLLSRVCVCECCRGPMFGEGLRLIRPCSELFGVAMVPLVFYACSPSCRRTFQNQTENLIQLLYQD
ncbi:leucine-rich repeat-containing protein 63 [Sardina pilchardus]|uniref:leucine-rich repeat-containing protein 63 n=1 Tax=Sardina pilchardus TaxID=27697 RepID=UPI002E157628